MISYAAPFSALGDRNMNRIGMGLVGFGLAGTHHIDAVRRLGFVDVVAVASSHPDAARKKAEQYGIRKVYGSFEELAADPEVQVVHNTTPNYLHAPVIMAAIANGKHIVSDKPLAINSTEALRVWRAAQAAGIVHAVTFNYRGNPLVQEARCRLAAGESGPVQFVHGGFLQDWLLEETDYSWRVDPAKGGRSCTVGDIGSHWCDLAEHVTGLHIDSVLADFTTVVKTRQRPAVSPQTFLHAEGEPTETVEITSEDLASVLLRFENGARGSLNVCQVAAGHKNDFWLEVNCRSGSILWDRDKHEELWLGHRHRSNEVLVKDPWLLHESVRRYTRLPGGHPEGYSDDFCNILSEVYDLIRRGESQPQSSSIVATFKDGYRNNCIVDAMLASHESGGTWTKVECEQ